MSSQAEILCKVFEDNSGALTIATALTATPNTGISGSI